MYLTHIPTWLQSCYPSYHWRIPTQEKVVYLTFDDGPTEEVTEWTLDQLAQYDARATFFVIGKNVQQHPSILQEVLKRGHIVGNHTFTQNMRQKQRFSALGKMFAAILTLPIRCWIKAIALAIIRSITSTAGGLLIRPICGTFSKVSNPSRNILAHAPVCIGLLMEE